MTGLEVQQLALPDVKFYMEPYIPHDSIVFAHGKFGTYKTPVLLNIAKGIAVGEPEIFGAVIQPGKCLFIQADTPKRVIVPRMQALDVAVDKLHFNFCFPGFDILNPAASELDLWYYQILAKQHKQEKYDIIFIDSLRAIHNLDDKESTSPHLVYRALRKLFPGATVVLLHHDTKFNPDKAHDETFSGSQAWLNHATVGIKFEHKDRGKEEITLHHTKSQASELVGPLAIGIREGIFARSLAQAKVDEVGGYIGQLLASGQPMNRKDIDKQVAEYFGVSERTARRRRIELAVANPEQFGFLGQPGD